jgi:RimJ/RimL family protein N-acetyltransferase
MMSTRSERGVALLERWGVQREGVLRQYSRMADGSWADVIVFSVVGDELAEMVARLEKELAEDG